MVIKFIKNIEVVLVPRDYIRGRLFGRTNVRNIKDWATANISRNVSRWPQISVGFAKT